MAESTQTTGAKQNRESQLLAKILDDLIRIPGTDWRFGLDPIIGLLPGIGDGTAASASMFIVFQGMRQGLPRIALLRMLLNILINTLLGGVPVVGDAFSAWFKSNRRNVRIMQAYEVHPRRAGIVDWILIVGFIVLLMALIVAMASVSIWMISQMFRLVTGD